MQTEAVLRSHSNNPIGKRYNDAYALLEKPVPELARINKTDRNQFIWWWQQREALDRWWPTKAQNHRGTLKPPRRGQAALPRGLPKDPAEDLKRSSAR